MTESFSRDEGKKRKSVVRPAMMYGLERLVVLEGQVKKMQVAELKMVRWALGVTRKDTIRNRHIRRTAKIAKLDDNLKSGRLRWFGHLKRRKKKHKRRRVLEMDVSGGRKQGDQRGGGWMQQERVCGGME